MSNWYIKIAHNCSFYIMKKCLDRWLSSINVKTTKELYEKSDLFKLTDEFLSVFSSGKLDPNICFDNKIFISELVRLHKNLFGKDINPEHIMGLDIAGLYGRIQKKENDKLMNELSDSLEDSREQAHGQDQDQLMSLYRYNHKPNQDQYLDDRFVDYDDYEKRWSRLYGVFN